MHRFDGAINTRPRGDYTPVPAMTHDLSGTYVRGRFVAPDSAATARSLTKHAKIKRTRTSPKQRVMVPVTSETIVRSRLTTPSE